MGRVRNEGEDEDDLSDRDPESIAHPSRFMPGNSAWRARSTHGRKPIYPVGPEGAEKLADACDQYFKWVEDNPLYEAKASAYEGDVTRYAMPKMRAMSVQALCLFIGVSVETWLQWRNNRIDLSEIINEVETAIRTQKFEGAAGGFLNASIIARDLGLAESIKKEVTGKDGAPLFTNKELTDDEVIEEAKRRGLPTNIFE